MCIVRDSGCRPPSICVSVLRPAFLSCGGGALRSLSCVDKGLLHAFTYKFQVADGQRKRKRRRMKGEG